MRHVAAYLLSVLGGNKAPTTEDVEKILSSVGIEADKEKLNKVIGELNGKNVQQLIDEGKTKLASVPAGGAAAVSAAPASSAAPAAAEKKEEKKKEEEKKVESESDEDLGFGLFD